MPKERAVCEVGRMLIVIHGESKVDTFSLEPDFGGSTERASVTLEQLRERVGVLLNSEEGYMTVVSGLRDG